MILAAMNKLCKIISMKKGLTENTADGILYGRSAKQNWSLCVGSGISQPLFPSWNELTRQLILEVTPSISDDEIGLLISDFRPDALIQAVFNRLKLKNESYTKLLSGKLFEKIKSQLNTSEWNAFKTCLSTKYPNDIPDKMDADFHDIITNPKLNTSALQIGKVISDIIGTELAPTGILSFNAESLLFSIINHFTKRKKKNNKLYCDFVNLSISSRDKSRIPYIFCHGTVPVPDAGEKHNKRLTTNDKLVFVENEYLQLDNTSFSWQANSFIELANSTTMVFIGVSLTDPNMRKWLSWTHSIRIKEIEFMNKVDNIDSTKHFWIRKEPDNPVLKSWIEANVSHLGVRLIWLKSWDNLEIVLRKMLKK